MVATGKVFASEGSEAQWGKDHRGSVVQGADAIHLPVIPLPHAEKMSRAHPLLHENCRTVSRPALLHVCSWVRRVLPQAQSGDSLIHGKVCRHDRLWDCGKSPSFMYLRNILKKPFISAQQLSSYLKKRRWNIVFDILLQTPELPCSLQKLGIFPWVLGQEVSWLCQSLGCLHITQWDLGG